MSTPVVRLAPQQLRVDEIPTINSNGDADTKFIVVYVTINVRVCAHTTYLSAYRCKMGQCTKGHNYHI